MAVNVVLYSEGVKHLDFSFPDIFTSITFSALLGTVFPLEGQQVTMGSGLAAKMETSELTAIIMCCVRSTPHMGAKLLNSAEFGMQRSAQPLTKADKISVYDSPVAAIQGDEDDFGYEIPTVEAPGPIPESYPSDEKDELEYMPGSEMPEERPDVNVSTDDDFDVPSAVDPPVFDDLATDSEHRDDIPALINGASTHSLRKINAQTRCVLFGARRWVVKPNGIIGTALRGSVDFFVFG
ncbi:hypothetical protein B0H13DRAFT_1874385 [Mycena leptocephala]|nr:hypothetical protein B0H13DRAFT_1874385 [Mycena leptocephala]